MFIYIYINKINAPVHTHTRVNNTPKLQLKLTLINLFSFYEEFQIIYEVS